MDKSLLELLLNELENKTDIQYNQTSPVMKDGRIEEFTITIDGKFFRCPCRCNVFHKPDDTNLNLYQCNACETQYFAD